MAVNGVHPVADEPREYVSAVCFDSPANRRAFEASELRRPYPAEAQPLGEGDGVWEELTAVVRLTWLMRWLTKRLAPWIYPQHRTA